LLRERRWRTIGQRTVRTLLIVVLAKLRQFLPGVVQRRQQPGNPPKEAAKSLATSSGRVNSITALARTNRAPHPQPSIRLTLASTGLYFAFK